MAFRTNTTERLRITSGGNILIGKTANSGKSLEVYQAGDAAIRIQNSASGTGSNDGILLEIGSSSKDALIWNYESANMRFGTAGTERLRIDSSGRVLIGTTTEGSSGADELTINTSSGHGGMTIRNDTSSNGNIWFSDGTSGSAEYAGYVQYAHNGDHMVFGTNGSERLRINSSGYLKHTGLRAGNSENKLAILVTPSYNTSEEDVIVYQAENESGSNQLTIGGGTGSYNATTTLRFLTASAVNTTGGEERLRIDSSGKLGVGDFSSTSVAQQLHVRGSEPQIYLEHTGGYDMTLTTSDGMGQNGITVNGGALSLAYNNKNIWMCRTGGKVGITSTSPTGALDVRTGTHGFDGFIKLTKDNNYNPSIEYYRTTGSGPTWYGAQLRLMTGDFTYSYAGAATLDNHSYSEMLRITQHGKVGIGDDNPVVQLHVKGGGHSHANLNVHTSIEDTTSYAQHVGGLQVFEGRYNSGNSEAVFSAIHGGKENATDGNYAGYLRFFTRAHGAMPVEVTRIASNGFMGVKTPEPQTALNVIGTVSTGRNVARELGTIINVSSNHNAARSGGNVINGSKEYEVGADWLAAGGARVNANLTIELPQAYTCDRFVIYNQNEYNHSNREVKNFTLEGSNDNSSWTTILDDDCGCSHGHEPNPGFSFRLPSGFNDDDEGVTYRYWRFTMKTFHGSDSYGGVCELELYQQHQSQYGRSEITTHSLVASDVNTQTLNGVERLTSSQGFNILTGVDASDTWEITEQGITTSGSFAERSTLRHKRGVMSVSSVYNTGDLYVRIDNLYNLPGNAWWTFSGLIISSQVVGTLAGHHSIVASFTITGLGSWSGISVNNIVNSCSASVSQHGSNFVEIQFDFNDSSRGANTVICNGGTFDPPRISFH
tara:strand:- start:212 stop:2866 length:2655 start_codon:yes stop_codon:yes gene_type:complete